MPAPRPYFGPTKVGYLWYLLLSVISWVLALPIAFLLGIIVGLGTMVLFNNPVAFLALYLFASVIVHFITYVLIFRGRRLV